MWVKASELRDLLDRKRPVWDNYLQLSRMTQDRVSARAIRRIMNGYSNITRYNVAEILMDVINEPMWMLEEVPWEEVDGFISKRKVDRDVMNRLLDEGRTKADVARYFGVSWITIKRNVDAQSRISQ